ncbi:hypothetical protein EDF77_0192 [Stenotrophomonas maltophilia]|nr:hypothetical protein EDF77_0192 [Stenotrophomonas maltophilia]
MAQPQWQRHKQRQQPAGLGVGGAGWLCRARRKYVRVAIVFPEGLQPLRQTDTVAPTHGRRMLGTWGLMDSADHGYAGRPDRHPAGRRKRRWQRLLPLPSALPLFFHFLRGRPPRNPSGGRAVGLGGGVERHGWRETRPAGCGSCRPPHSPAARTQSRRLLFAAARGFHPFDAPTASDPAPRRRSIITEMPHNSRPTAAVAAPT